MPSEKENILEFNQYMKSDKMPYVIYADIDSLIKKIHGYADNPENFSTAKIGEHIPCGYSLSTVWGFDRIEDKHTLYRGKDCMKKPCTSLREHLKNIIDFEKKKMLPVTKEKLKSNQDAMVWYIRGKRISKNFSKSIKYQKARDQCHFMGKYRGAAHSICNLEFNVPNEVPVVFHNGSNYDCHFIIKELVNEFEGHFECLGKNTEKYKIFSVSAEKEITKIDKDGNESVVIISYKVKFIDSARFMASSLSNLSRRRNP